MASERPAPLKAVAVGNTEDDRASLEERVAKQATELERMGFELELARATQDRLGQERDRLEQTVADLEHDRGRLREEIASRERLLDVIFRSRSWRLTQAVRRVLGRH